MTTCFDSLRPAFLAGYLGLVLATAGCTDPASKTVTPEFYSAADFAGVRKFDAHVHANTSSAVFLEQARADNFELLSINVDYPDFPSLAAQEEAALNQAAVDPERFHFATTFSTADWGGKADWAATVNAKLDQAAARGAVAVKVWKNIGMSLRDTNGKLVMIDDPGFDPVFAHVRAMGLPLIGHLGEPRNCWLPLTEMTTNNDRSYFREHPQYHMFLQPQMPSYEAQIAARDRRLERTPDLRFVGAHLASLEWSVDRLAAFLDTHPNAVVDMAARMTNLQYQSHLGRDEVRDFFIRYQDRILYGSDLTFDPDSDPAEFRQEAHTTWLSAWTYMATREISHVADIDADVMGLQLPRAAMDKIFWSNARRTFFSPRAAWPAGAAKPSDDDKLAGE
jgi:predicted TIM-barrel fold metal-dependent hydrolase